MVRTVDCDSARVGSNPTARPISKKDFEKAKEALRKAHVPGPYKAIYNLDA